MPVIKSPSQKPATPTESTTTPVDRPGSPAVTTPPITETVKSYSERPSPTTDPSATPKVPLSNREVNHPENVFEEAQFPSTTPDDTTTPQNKAQRDYERQQRWQLSDSIQAGKSDRLINYLINNIQDGNIGKAHQQNLLQLAEYNHTLNEQMSRIETLATKIDNSQSLSPNETVELKALLHANKHNLGIAVSALMEMQKSGDQGQLSVQENAVVDSLTKHLVKQHIALADQMAQYDGMLPDNEPVSRSDRIDYALLRARVARDAVAEMNLPATAHEKVVATIDAQCQTLEHHADLEKGLSASQDQEGLAFEELDAWTTNFDLVKDKKISKLPAKEVAKLKAHWDQKNAQADSAKRSPWLPLSHPKISQADIIQLFIEHQLDTEGVAKSARPDLKFLFQKSLANVINNREWAVITKPVSFKLGDTEHTYTSQITPAGRLPKHFASDYESNGFSCVDRLQYKHVPNLAHTQLTTEDGKVIVSALRHGILDPYEITAENLQKLPDEQLATMVDDLVLDNDPLAKDLSGEPRKQWAMGYVNEIKTNKDYATEISESMRQESGKIMAKELLSAAIISNPEKLETALSTGAVDVEMGSISLVTPDYLRTLKGSASGNEQAMLDHQVQALQALTKNPPVEIALRDEAGVKKNVAVTPKIRTFNFGVNKGAVGISSTMHGLMGWGFATKLNNPELEKLLGPSNSHALGGETLRMARTMATDPNSAATRKRGELLEKAASQLKQIWIDQSFKTSGNEPYKMVVRLGYVLQLMGETPLFNCKSGKDRTGQLDVELKNLASIGHITDNLPEPDARQTSETRNMRTAFALHAGNHEVQRQNVGLPGFKLGGLPALEDMINAGEWKNYQGGSKFVKT